MHTSLKPLPQLVISFLLGAILFGGIFLSGLKNNDLEGLRAEPVHQWACKVEGRKYGKHFEEVQGFFAETNICPFFDLEEGLDYSRKYNRPALLYFTGHTAYCCTPPHRKEFFIFPLNKLIREKVVLIALYVDDRTELNNAESINGKEVETIGKKIFKSRKCFTEQLLSPILPWLIVT